MYILDSDVLTFVSGTRINENVSEWYNSINETDIYLTVIAIKEQAKNATRLARNGRHSQAQRVEKTLRDLQTMFSDRILALDASASETWGRMLGNKEAHIMDTAIAAIAKQGGFIVVTRNIKHFEGRGVALVDPFEKPPRKYEAV